MTSLPVGASKHPEAFEIGGPRSTLALLTNVVAPYRVPIYNALGKCFNLSLVTSGPEDNRREWAGVDAQLRNVRVRATAGLTFKYFAPRSGDASDDRYLHINPGYLVELMKLRPDAVISIEMGFRSLCALLYCAVARVPLWIWWEGSIDTERNIGSARRLVRNVIARHAVRWFSGGLNATKYLVTLGVDLDRIVHAQNCVDETQFENVRIAPTRLGPKPVILVVGRLVPGKGVGLLLDALARLQNEGYCFSVMIVGDGSERMSLQKQAQTLGLTKVEFHGARPQSEMPAYYRGADMLLLPTLHDVWGLVVSEAMWSGLPVLVSKYAGCADEIVPVDQIFDPLDGDALCARLREAIANGLPPVDQSPLRRIQSVADAMVTDVVAHLPERARDNRESTSGKQRIQAIVRDAHLRLLNRGLPDRIAIYFHQLDHQCHGSFAEMITHFRELGYTFVGPQAFVSPAGDNKRLFVSFDDNFDTWHDAIALFERVGLQATFYVNPSPFADRASPTVIADYYRRIHQPMSTKPLTTAGLRDLMAAGHNIGSHTYSHPLLRSLPTAEAIEEIDHGRAELEALLGKPVLDFAYPFGMARHFSSSLRAYCRRAGILTVANAIPGCLHMHPRPESICRTGWDLWQPMDRNLQNLCVDGSLFARITGRSPLGQIFAS